jgi:hypothetical protein
MLFRGRYPATDLHATIILQLFLDKQGRKVWTGLIWLRVGNTNGISILHIFGLVNGFFNLTASNVNRIYSKNKATSCVV